MLYNDTVKIVENKDLRLSNVLKLKSLAHSVASIFGPCGLTKLVLKTKDEYFVTQKGHKIATTFTNKTPIVNILKRLMATQHTNCGDGTKTVLLLIGLMLEKANKLVEEGISPQIINKGYFLALNKCLEIIENNQIALNGKNEDCLIKIIECTLTNKYSIHVKDYFINLLKSLNENNESMVSVLSEHDFHDYYFRKVAGNGLLDSELLHGFIIYKNKPNSIMPDRILNPNILLIQKSIDYFIKENHSMFLESSVESTQDHHKLVGFEEDYYKKLSESIKNKGIDVIFCQKRVNEEFLNSCSKLGMIVLDSVGEKEIKTLSMMLHIGPISSINEISENDVGIADIAEFKKFAKDEMLIIRKRKANTLTFLLRGGTKHVLDEFHESLETAIRVGYNTLKSMKVLPGGGAIELQCSQQLQLYANNFADKLQLVILEYAKVFESLIGYIIVNSGEDPLTIIPNLKKFHSQKKNNYGYDVKAKSIVNVIDNGTLDDYFTKVHAIKIATEMACQINRIDRLVMVHDRKLYEELEQQGKQQKMEKRNEDIRQYFKKNEEDFRM
ncbi:MAG: hypothetical protein EU530_03535 [Promethearchaeota archaeon]|nr:MAG: hypothetical protein EU530_03535 [Candidatus Lokiarchaeota archaeon]